MVFWWLPITVAYFENMAPMGNSCFWLVKLSLFPFEIPGPINQTLKEWCMEVLFKNDRWAWLSLPLNLWFSKYSKYIVYRSEVQIILLQTVQYYHYSTCLNFTLYAKQKYNLIDVIHYCWYKQTMHVNKIIIYV